MLEPRVTTKLRGVVLKLLKDIELLNHFSNLPNEQHLAYQRLQKIHLPSYKTDLVDLL